MQIKLYVFNVKVDSFVSFFCESPPHVFSIIYFDLWLFTYRIRGVLYVCRGWNFCCFFYWDTLSNLILQWVFLMYLLISKNRLLVLMVWKISVISLLIQVFTSCLGNYFLFKFSKYFLEHFKFCFIGKTLIILDLIWDRRWIQNLSLFFYFIFCSSLY